MDLLKCKFRFFTPELTVAVHAGCINMDNLVKNMKVFVVADVVSAP